MCLESGSHLQTVAWPIRGDGGCSKGMINPRARYIYYAYIGLYMPISWGALIYMPIYIVFVFFFEGLMGIYDRREVFGGIFTGIMWFRSYDIRYLNSSKIFTNSSFNCLQNFSVVPASPRTVCFLQCTGSPVESGRATHRKPRGVGTTWAGAHARLHGSFSDPPRFHLPQLVSFPIRNGCFSKQQFAAFS